MIFVRLHDKMCFPNNVAFFCLQGSAGAWGDYYCNIPLETMNLFFDKARELNPDFIIYSGNDCLSIHIFYGPSI